MPDPLPKLIAVLLLPLVTALVGWGTNSLAIHMLFRPKKPIQFLGLRIQGIFPKRQKQLAERLGEIVENELFSLDDLRRHIESPDLQQHLMGIVGRRIDELVDQKINTQMPILSMFITEEVRGKIKFTLKNDIENALPEIVGAVLQNLEEHLDIKQVVSEKVACFPPNKIESMLKSIMKKEFRFVELLGGLLGFFVGLAQVLLYFLFA